MEKNPKFRPATQPRGLGSGSRSSCWLGWLAFCALPWLALAWPCLACLARLALAWSSNNNRPSSAAGGGCAAAVVFAAGPGQGKAARQARQGQARASQGKAQQVSQPIKDDVPVFLTHKHMEGKLRKIITSGMNDVQVPPFELTLSQDRAMASRNPMETFSAPKTAKDTK